MREVVAAVGETEVAQHLRGPLSPVLSRHGERDERGLHILLRGEGRDQVERLKDESEGVGSQVRHFGFAQSLQRLTVEDDLAAAGPVEPSQQREQRGFALAGGASDSQELALGNSQLDTVEGPHKRGVPAEVFVDVAENVDAAGTALGCGVH